jgi:hypothetical protein
MESSAASRLWEIEEIRRLKARYFRCVDTQDWVGLATLFTADATMFFPENQDAPVNARDGIAFISGALLGGVSIHHGHMEEIELTSPNCARGIWAMIDRIFWADASAGTLGLEGLCGSGHYHDEYRKVTGHWLIQSFRLSRLRASTQPAPTSVI